LSVNVSWDKEGPARNFVERYRLPFPVGRDADGKIGDLYGVDSTPISLFIGKDGKLVDRLVGAPDDAQQIEAGLERRVTWLLGG
jgi:peroxiredoxin